MFRTAILANSFAALADSVYGIGVIWLIIQATRSGLQVTLLSVIGGLIGIALMPLAGLWLDGRHGWRLVLGADVSRCLLVVAAYGFAACSLTTLGLWIGFVGFAIANSFYTPIQQVLVTRLTDENTRSVGVARMKSGVRAARILGPALGGIASEIGGTGGLSLITVAALQVSLVCNLILRRNIRSLDLRRPQKSILSDISEALSYIVASRPLVTILATGIVVNLAHSTFVIALPILVQAQQEGTGTAYGLLLTSHNTAALATMLVLGVAYVSRKATKPPHNLLYGLLILALGFLLLAADARPGVLAGVVFVGIGVAAVSVLGETWMTLVTSEHMQARVFASVQSATLSLRPIGIVVGGLAANTHSYFGLAIINGALIIGVAIWIAVWYRQT